MLMKYKFLYVIIAIVISSTLISCQQNDTISDAQVNSEIEELRRENESLKKQLEDSSSYPSYVENEETSVSSQVYDVVPSSSPENDIPDNAISLYWDGDEILCGSTKDNYSDLIDCIIKQDEYGLQEMFLLGQAFAVPSNTKAIILEQKIGQTKVRICEGDYVNEIAWVASEATSK